MGPKEPALAGVMALGELVIQNCTTIKIKSSSNKTSDTNQISNSYENNLRAICICSAINELLLFLKADMRLSHDTSTPFPASHSLRTSIAMSFGLPRQFSEIMAILFPRVSLSRKLPNTVISGPTREGKSISSSCSRSGFAAETVRGRE